MHFVRVLLIVHWNVTFLIVAAATDVEARNAQPAALPGLLAAPVHRLHVRRLDHSRAGARQSGFSLKLKQ